jgi:hypothetical protein
MELEEVRHKSKQGNGQKTGKKVRVLLNDKNIIDTSPNGGVIKKQEQKVGFF